MPSASLHATAGPVDRDVVVGVVCRPLRRLVLGQVVGLVLDAQADAGCCQGEEREAGVAGTGGQRVMLVVCAFVLSLPLVVIL